MRPSLLRLGRARGRLRRKWRKGCGRPLVDSARRRAAGAARGRAMGEGRGDRGGDGGAENESLAGGGRQGAARSRRAGTRAKLICASRPFSPLAHWGGKYTPRSKPSTPAQAPTDRPRPARGPSPPARSRHAVAQGPGGSRDAAAAVGEAAPPPGPRIGGAARRPAARAARGRRRARSAARQARRARTRAGRRRCAARAAAPRDVLPHRDRAERGPRAAVLWAVAAQDDRCQDHGKGARGAAGGAAMGREGLQHGVEQGRGQAGGGGGRRTALAAGGGRLGSLCPAAAAALLRPGDARPATAPRCTRRSRARAAGSMATSCASPR
jgi:hypothetical protein